jgi:HAD superfamily hydrolase (TIGR01509 family)
MPAPIAQLWDLDGTLVDSEPVHLAAFTDVLAEMGVAAPPDFHQMMFGRALPDVCALSIQRFGLNATVAELSALQLRAFAARSEELAPRAEGLFVFTRQRARGVRQAIVSNSDRVIVNVSLRALELDTPALVSVTRNDVLRGKPDPEPFLRAAYLLGATPRECVVIEDSPVGVAGGVAAGMWVIAFPEPRSGPPLEFPPGVPVARDGAELARLLDEPG